MIDEDKLLLACWQAQVEFQTWLGCIGSSSILTYKPGHPFEGIGAPAGEIAQVVYYGQTHHGHWHKKLVASGITSLTQVTYTMSRRMIDEWLIEQPMCETHSERARTVGALLRAEKNGMVIRNEPLTGKGKPCGSRYWMLSEQGEQRIAVEAVYLGKWLSCRTDDAAQVLYHRGKETLTVSPSFFAPKYPGVEKVPVQRKPFSITLRDA